MTYVLPMSVACDDIDIIMAIDKISYFIALICESSISVVVILILTIGAEYGRRRNDNFMPDSIFIWTISL